MNRSRFFAPVRVVAASLGLLLVSLGVLGVTGIGPAAAVGSVHSPITGSGSTWSQNALEAWIRNVWANYQWKIEYSGGGSTQGRNDFAQGVKDFGVTEIPYGIANSNEADNRPGRKFAYMPIVAGGTALMYNLQIAGKRVTNLRLSGDTTAKIFTGAITRWNDPQILEDNPQLALPDIPIVPVVRADGSGATAQVSIWLRQEHTALWDAYCGKVGRPMVNGHCGVTSNYPVVPGSGFISKKGSDGVAGYVAQSYATGSITFVEYSYALNSGFPVAKLLNSAGYYAEPTAANVAVGLLRAHINEDVNSPDYTVQDLSDVYTNSDRRAYPLSSYSYMIVPTELEANFTENKGLTLGDFGSYFLCEGQQSAEVLGYSPLPVNLVKAGQRQIQKVKGSDPARTGFSIGSCNNPTLDPNDPNGNALAKNAPYPEECDKKGPVQCFRGTGGAKDTSTDPSADVSGPADTTGDAATSADPNAPAAETAARTSGLVTNGAPVVLAATPQALPVATIGLLAPVAVLASGLAMLAAAILPPFLGRYRRRSGLPPGLRIPRAAGRNARS